MCSNFSILESYFSEKKMCSTGISGGESEWEEGLGANFPIRIMNLTSIT